MKLEFNDGVSFDTSGPMRPERRHDGWYAVGNGMLLPADSLQEAQSMCKEFDPTEVFEDSTSDKNSGK